VDPVDLAVNIGGWIVAGLSTAGGVVLAYWLERKARNRDDDLRELYNPFRLDVLKIIDGAGNPNGGGVVWPGRGEEFQKRARSGLLGLKRHKKLERDLVELQRLDVANEDAYAKFAPNHPAGRAIDPKDPDLDRLKSTGADLVRHANAMLSCLDRAIQSRWFRY
jgi:hypothetical protein